LATSWGALPAGSTRHKAQEAEANRFAIELLAPQKLMRRYLSGLPDLARVIALSDELEISREAGARRYIELKDEPTALVCSLEGVVRYVQRNPGFPFVACQSGQRLSLLPSAVDNSEVSAHEEADPRDWLGRSKGEPLIIQTLSQGEGYAITLLAIDPSAGNENQEA
jgi:hypothetical protein